MESPGALLSPSSKKMKKARPEKISYIFLYFEEWNFLAPRLNNVSRELSCPIIKNFLIFSGNETL